MSSDINVIGAVLKNKFNIVSLLTLILYVLITGHKLTFDELLDFITNNYIGFREEMR